jgi:PilZ domain
MMKNATEAAAAPARTRRTSHRVHHTVPVHVSGRDNSGRSFGEAARTEIITRDGGLIITAATLTTGNEIRVRNGDKVVLARVVGLVGVRGDEMAYGIMFTSAPEGEFWGMHFPALAETGVGRTVLECARCMAKRVFELSEVEMMVLENLKVVSLPCQHCAKETLWQLPANLIEVELVEAELAIPRANRSSLPRTGNTRKHPRIAMKNTRACIRCRGANDEVVDVVDVSRGGVRFSTYIDYPKDANVEIAVPYTEGGLNVFVPARIVRKNTNPTADSAGEFAVQYENRH